MIKKGFILLVFLFISIQNSFSDYNKLIHNNTTSPKFELNFQNPSYILEKETLNNIFYLCDNKKTECKVNLILLQPDGNKSLSSRMSCKITTTFHSEDFDKCNPNTVTFPQGIHPINIKVSENNNPENFSEYNFIIINGDIDLDILEIEKNKILFLSNNDHIINTPICSGEVVVGKIISDEVTIGEIINNIATEDGDNNQTTEDGDNNQTTEEEKIIIPDFKYIFQRPSYIILPNQEENIFICDNKKSNLCKVNLKLLSNEGEDISSNFECKISFSTEGLAPLEKCNPNTIIFPKGDTQIIFEVYDKKNRDNFKKQIIWIKNLKKIDSKVEEDNSIIGTDSSISDTNPSQPQGANTEKNSPLIPKDPPETLIPDFKYLLQNPSYLIPSDEESVYICDKSKGIECRVNLKLISLENKNISSRFGCEISFGVENLTTLKNCNPNTVIFPEGNNEVILKIFEKNNVNNFKKQILQIINSDNNSEKIHNNSPSLSSLNIAKKSSKQITGDVTVNNQSDYHLPKTKIKVQGKIGKTKKVGITRMKCYTYNECKINFTAGTLYKSEREGIEFRWNFGNGQKYNDYNPKSVKFKPGNYKVKLTVTNNHGNKHIEVYRVEVINLYTKVEIKNINKTVNTLIDFNISSELNHQFQTYLPDQYVSFMRTQKSFNEVVNKDNTFISWNKNIVSDSESFKGEQESNILGNVKILAKNMKLRVDFQKKNLKIYGKTIPNSDIEIKIGENIFITTSNDNGQYEIKVNSKISQGNYKIQATAYNQDSEIVAQKQSREKKITQDYINQLKSYIKIEGGKKSSENGNAQKITNEILEKQLAKNISLRVSLQKKNLKIYGTTSAESKVIFTIGKQIFSTTSDNTGKYELKINSIEEGSYNVQASVFSYGKLVAQKSSSKKVFSPEYIANMKSYLTKKTTLKKSSKTGKSKYKKFTLENIPPKIPSFILNTGFNLKVFVINMLIAILSLLLLFVVLIKRKLI